MMETQKQYAQLIAEICTKTGLGVRTIAKRLDMSYRTWQNWQKGTQPDRPAQILIEILHESPRLRKKLLKS